IFFAEGHQSQAHFSLRLQRKHQEFKRRWRQRDGRIAHRWLYVFSVVWKLMATPDEERIQAMAEEIALLKRKAADLEARVRALEWPATPMIGEPFSVQTPPPLPEPPIPHPLPPPIPPALPPTPSVEAPALETRLGLNWVNRIAVFTLLLGAAFL